MFDFNKGWDDFFHRFLLVFELMGERGGPKKKEKEKKELYI